MLSQSSPGLVSENPRSSGSSVLKSDFLTQGPTIAQFERAIAEYCGVKHAVAVSNATAALHIARLEASTRIDDGGQRSVCGK